MAVKLESTIKRWFGDSTDPKPAPGLVQANGNTIGVADVPVGSAFFEEDTGRVYRWNGSSWTIPSVQDETLLVLEEILLEQRAIRSGIELALSLNHGVHVDLKTEAITELQEQ